jgi:hypothetical protein
VHEALGVLINRPDNPKERRTGKGLRGTRRVVGEKIAGDASDMGLQSGLLLRCEDELTGEPMKYDCGLNCIQRGLYLFLCIIEGEVNGHRDVYPPDDLRLYSRYCLSRSAPSSSCPALRKRTWHHGHD